MAAVAKSKNVKKKPLNFKQLMRRVSQNEEKFPQFLKTAALEGWLIDGNFATQLVPDEQVECRELYGKTKSAKKTEATDVENSLLPSIVGPAVINVKESASHVRLTNITGNISVAVDRVLFVTLKKRHPKADVHFDMENPLTEHIIFSDGNEVVALLKPLQ